MEEEEEEEEEEEDNDDDGDDDEASRLGLTREPVWPSGKANAGKHIDLYGYIGPLVSRGTFTFVVLARSKIR